jgi:hypothetical protein
MIVFHDNYDVIRISNKYNGFVYPSLVADKYYLPQF